MTTSPIEIFLVDDDPLFLKSLEIDFLHKSNFTVKTFCSGETCVAHLDENPSIIILDYHLNGIEPNAMHGISTLDIIKEKNPNIDVIMLSSQDKIEVAIDCMHHKAFDYIVKSETAFIRLQKTINSIFESRKMKKQLKWYMDRM
jgi:two-component system, OmpR family, response regulator